MTIPSSTYRLQVNRRFTLDDAARVVGYLSELGRRGGVPVTDTAVDDRF